MGLEKPCRNHTSNHNHGADVMEMAISGEGGGGYCTKHGLKVNKRRGNDCGWAS